MRTGRFSVIGKVGTILLWEADPWFTDIAGIRVSV
jgi:hypothetical protein